MSDAATVRGDRWVTRCRDDGTVGNVPSRSRSFRCADAHPAPGPAVAARRLPNAPDDARYPPAPSDRYRWQFQARSGPCTAAKAPRATPPASPGARPAQVCESCPPQAHGQCARQSAQRTDGGSKREGWCAAISRAARRPHFRTIAQAGRGEASAPADALLAGSGPRFPEAARGVPMPRRSARALNPPRPPTILFP